MPKNMREVREFWDQSLLMETDDCIIWPYLKYTTGYSRYDQKNGHRLVCEKIYGPPPTPQHDAAHSPKCVSKACINKRHLRWATKKENQADRLISGTHNRGERCGLSKLSKYDVLEIRRLRNEKCYSGLQLADMYGISPSNIYDIMSNRNWGWLEDPSDAELIFDTTKPRMKDLFA
jgi:hypothetical protein